MSAFSEKLSTALIRRGENTVAHAAVVAIVLTGVFMAYTSSAWGVMAPLIIALSCYLVIAAVLFEVMLIARAGLRALASRARRSGEGSAAGIAAGGGR